jgi:hypothetical protein
MPPFLIVDDAGTSGLPIGVPLYSSLLHFVTVDRPIFLITEPIADANVPNPQP